LRRSEFDIAKFRIFGNIKIEINERDTFMKNNILFLLCFIFVISGCGTHSTSQKTLDEEKITKEFLISNGFKQSNSDANIFFLHHVRLKDAAHNLDFNIHDVKPTVNPYEYFVSGTVKIKNLYFVIESEVRDEHGRLVPNSISNPDSLCTISISLAQLPLCPSFQAAKSKPTLKIISVIVPEKEDTPLQVEFDLKSDSLTPIAFSKDQFTIHISNDSEPDIFVGDAVFGKEAKNIINVEPGQLVRLSATTQNNKINSHITSWHNLAPGEYNLRICINSDKEADFDYQWLGQTYSNSYPLIIK
jgi:hypothetical protein